jgi:hypothetical protein
VTDDAGAQSPAATVTVTVGSSTNVGGLDWYSDWRTGTGDTQTVLYDGGRFNRRLCGGIVAGGFDWDDLLDVVPAGPQMVPAGVSSALRITYHDGGVDACNMLAADQAWRTPGVGEYLYSRIYLYADIDVGEEAVGHWFHHGSNAAGNDYPFFWSGQDTGVAADSSFAVWAAVGPAGGVSGPGHGSFGTRLKTHRLYRLETRIHRTHADSLQFDVRVYQGSTLVRTGGDFKCQSGPCGYGTQSVNQYRVHYTGQRGLNSLEVGNNGPAQQPVGQAYRYVSGVAIRVSGSPNDWIGTYPVVGAEN